MLSSFKKLLDWVTSNAAFVMTFYAISCAMIMAFWHDDDATTMVPAMLGMYLGQTAGRSISGHWAASRDPQANTMQAIREIEGLIKPDAPKPEGQ